MFFKGSQFRGRHFTPKQKIIKGVFRKHKVAVKRNIYLFEINPQIVYPQPVKQFTLSLESTYIVCGAGKDAVRQRA